MKELKYRTEVKLYSKCAACNHFNDETLHKFCQKCGQSLAKLMRIPLCPFCGQDRKNWHHTCTPDAVRHFVFDFDGDGHYHDDAVFLDRDGDPWLVEYSMDYDSEESTDRPVDWAWVQDKLASEIKAANCRLAQLLDTEGLMRKKGWFKDER